MLFRCDGYPLHVKSTKIKYLFRARARAPVVCAESSIAPVVCAESSIAPFIRFDCIHVGTQYSRPDENVLSSSWKGQELK